MDLRHLGMAASADFSAHTLYRNSHSPKPPTTSAGGSEIAAALEAAWYDIQAQHPDVPDVLMITGSGIDNRGLKWGHFARDRWHDDITDGKLPELFVGGERLATGAELTVQTLLHEATHAVAAVRNIQDTSRQHRYHNGRFRELAAEMGLHYEPERPDSVIGYSAVTLTDQARDAYASTIEALDKAIHLHIPSHLLTLLGGKLPGGHGGKITGLGPKGTGGAQRMRLTCQCDPERIIYAAASTYDFAAIRCEACDGEFLSAKDSASRRRG
jgi:hypothetical protein